MFNLWETEKALVQQRLDELESRLIRIESRIVQLMYHMGTKPKGAVPIKLPTNEGDER